MDFAITDHALLRFMERVHGVDVETWRELMRKDLVASVEAFDGVSAKGGPAYIIDGNTVITVLSRDFRPSKRMACRGSIAVPIKTMGEG